MLGHTLHTLKHMLLSSMLSLLVDHTTLRGLDNLAASDHLFQGQMYAFAILHRVEKSVHACPRVGTSGKFYIGPVLTAL